MEKCKCETFSYYTYTAVCVYGNTIYAGHYKCAAVRALKSLPGQILTWQHGKIIETNVVNE